MQTSRGYKDQRRGLRVAEGTRGHREGHNSRVSTVLINASRPQLYYHACIFACIADKAKLHNTRPNTQQQ
jgi:hypothetical protein